MQSKGNVHPLLMGVKTCKATVDISVAVPQKAGNKFFSKSNYTILAYVFKTLYILVQKDLTMFIPALLMICRNWK